MKADIKPQVCCTGHRHHLRPGRGTGLGGKQCQAARCGHTVAWRARWAGKSPHKCLSPSAAVWKADRAVSRAVGPCKRSLVLPGD